MILRPTFSEEKFISDEGGEILIQKIRLICSFSFFCDFFRMCDFSTVSRNTRQGTN